MIHFTKVSKSYHGNTALNNINFELQKGEMAFLTGHSGAGKSTLLKLIMLIERPTRGQIFVNERNLDRLPARQIPYLRRDIGVIFQNPHLLDNLTVYDNVALPLLIAGVRHQDIQGKVLAALDKVGLLGKERCYPPSLSGGEQQRVGIARAVVNKPTILLADEPTGNLDPELSLEIIKLFAAFNAVGVTALIATHDLTLIAPLHYRMITLKSGQITHGGKDG